MHVLPLRASPHMKQQQEDTLDTLDTDSAGSCGKTRKGENDAVDEWERRRWAFEGANAGATRGERRGERERKDF